MYARNDVIIWNFHIIDCILTEIFDRELRGFSENVIIYHLNISKLFFFLISQTNYGTKVFYDKNENDSLFIFAKENCLFNFHKREMLKKWPKVIFHVILASFVTI